MVVTGLTCARIELYGFPGKSRTANLKYVKELFLRHIFKHKITLRKNSNNSVLTKTLRKGNFQNENVNAFANNFETVFSYTNLCKIQTVVTQHFPVGRKARVTFRVYSYCEPGLPVHERDVFWTSTKAKNSNNCGQTFERLAS